MKGIHVTSEIKPLKKVLLHRPGRELLNLTPDTLQELLFDDIPFLKVAQEEHDAFAQILRDNGVEVVYLEDLMNADEVIITCCDTFCIRTVEIDGKPVGGKNPEMLKKLQDYLMNDFLIKTDINNTDKGEIK